MARYGGRRVRRRRGGPWAGLALVFALAAPLGARAAPADLLASSTGGITLDGRPHTLSLASPAGTDGLAQLGTLPPERRLSLLVAGLPADEPGGTTYNVFAGEVATPPPAGTTDPRYLGTFGLFAAGGRDETGARVVALDVTERLRALLSTGALGDPLRITIVPMGGKPHPISIARVSLVAR